MPIAMFYQSVEYLCWKAFSDGEWALSTVHLWLNTRRWSSIHHCANCQKF